VIPPIVDLGWWRSRQLDVVAADVRWYLDGRSGRAAYASGHLPGAVFVELEQALAAPAAPAAGRHPLPDPAVFARELGALGIADEDVVVAYDDAGGIVAARLVWLLRALGQPAAVLDGGLGAYDGPLERSAPLPRAVVRRPRAWPEELIADADDAADPANVVLDARARPRYLGEVEPIDPRAGHVPGARSLPAGDTIGADGRISSVPELRRRFAVAGVREDSRVVSYCGSGVTACHTLLALELAGFAPGRLYAGSWSQWSHDPDRAVATGEEPG
jgi:thiosulfate/3-mercaptopyruvate sulfurtransferase